VYAQGEEAVIALVEDLLEQIKQLELRVVKIRESAQQNES
jgi:hypothetical protein